MAVADLLWHLKVEMKDFWWLRLEKLEEWVDWYQKAYAVLFILHLPTPCTEITMSIALVLICNRNWKQMQAAVGGTGWEQAKLHRERHEIRVVDTVMLRKNNFSMVSNKSLLGLESYCNTEILKLPNKQWTFQLENHSCGLQSLALERAWRYSGEFIDWI